MLKTIIHVVVFLVAAVVFYVGLFTGLQVNPNVGTILWIAAAADSRTEHPVDPAVEKEVIPSGTGE